MKKSVKDKRVKCLTVAGFDPCGGAGIQADLKVFHRLGAYGLSVVTAVTIQNTQGVFGIHRISGDVVYKQLECLSDDIRIDAIKIGILCFKDVVKAVVDFLKGDDNKIVVLDTPVISSSGTPLINKEALRFLIRHLIPQTTVITPNIPEAELLTGIKIKSAQDIKDCARCLYDLGAGGVVIKGGHYKHKKGKISDLVFDGNGYELIHGHVYQGDFHGTGCVYSSALTVYLCNGLHLFDSAKGARDFVVSTMKSHINIGLGMSILGV